MLSKSLKRCSTERKPSIDPRILIHQELNETQLLNRAIRMDYNAEKEENDLYAEEVKKMEEQLAGNQSKRMWNCGSLSIPFPSPSHFLLFHPSRTSHSHHFRVHPSLD